MDEVLRKADLFQGMGDEEIQAVAALGHRSDLSAGEYLFLLGDVADRLYVVTTGTIDLCFPMLLGETVRDIAVETIRPGQALGWSALVRPYRLTLTARASTPSSVMGFARADLLQFFEQAPRVGYQMLTRVSEIVGYRLLTVQALWARGLQRILDAEKPEERP